MSGKGSAPRPFSVDNETFKRNFDAIFGKTNEQFIQNSSSSECSVACEGCANGQEPQESAAKAQKACQVKLGG